MRVTLIRSFSAARGCSAGGEGVSELQEVANKSEKAFEREQESERFQSEGGRAFSAPNNHYKRFHNINFKIKPMLMKYFNINFWKNRC